MSAKTSNQNHYKGLNVWFEKIQGAVASGHPSSSSFLFECCRDHQLRETILKQDRNVCNALHRAIRNGHWDLALNLIQLEATLSHAVNEQNESPMFIAVSRGFTEIFVELLKIQSSADAGACGYNALHAALKTGNSGKTCRLPITV